MFEPAFMNIDDGAAGFLLNPGWAKIFYIRDMDGGLCGVNAHRSRGGWSVLARPVDYRSARGDGQLVFSRRSAAWLTSPLVL
jgi:hypothetical protein